MEKNLKRGVDLQNRIGDNWSGAKRLQEIFKEGSPIGKITLFGLFIVFLVNFFIVLPLIGKDLSVAYSSSFLAAVSGFLPFPKNEFFAFLTVVGLSFAPISIYLFARRILKRKELIAFIATILFIIPNPVTPSGNPLLTSFLQGDASHVLAFAFIPLLALYARGFLFKGYYPWAIISIFGTALIALISPFAFFNILIFLSILAISGSFIHGFRISIARMLIIVIFSLALTSFWYHPDALTKIMLLNSVNTAIGYFLKIFPVLIPVGLIFGSISFLIFDRRRELQPIFIISSLLVSYVSLYLVSVDLHAEGLFTPSRYIPEISFSTVLVIAYFSGFMFDFVKSKLKQQIQQNRVIYFLTYFLLTLFVLVFGFFSVENIQELQTKLRFLEVENSYTGGVGSLVRDGLFSEFVPLFPTAVSIFTLILLFFILKLSSAKFKKLKSSG